MTTITIPKKELRVVVKESVREVLTQELMKLRALLLPFVSQKEQKNIEKLYGKPSRNVAKSIQIEVGIGALIFQKILGDYLVKNNLSESIIIEKIKLALRKFKGEDVNGTLKNGEVNGKGFIGYEMENGE